MERGMTKETQASQALEADGPGQTAASPLGSTLSPLRHCFLLSKELLSQCPLRPVESQRCQDGGKGGMSGPEPRARAQSRCSDSVPAGVQSALKSSRVQGTAGLSGAAPFLPGVPFPMLAGILQGRLRGSLLRGSGPTGPTGRAAAESRAGSSRIVGLLRERPAASVASRGWAASVTSARLGPPPP